MKNSCSVNDRLFQVPASKIIAWGFGFISILFLPGFFGFTSVVIASMYSDPYTGKDPLCVERRNEFSAAVPAFSANEKQCVPKRHEEISTAEFYFETDSATTAKAAQEMIDHAFELCQRADRHWKADQADTAIETLDRAYSIILGMNFDGNADFVQQIEDMRFIISKRIYEIYASRKMNIDGIGSEIPVFINRQVQHEINLYTAGNLRAHFIESYKRSGKYRQMIVEMLEKEGLPEELSWLPLVESGFKVSALSHRRALGLWQFIPSTGYKYGLVRDEYVDERLDPVKSTEAAIRYLKNLHRHFGDWSTALAAYNCGESRVLRVIRNQKINYLDNFWDLYNELPQETANYVPKFLATIHIVNNLSRYGLEDIEVDTPLHYDSIKVTKIIRLDDVAKMAGTHTAKLVELNPELRQGVVPGDNYMLKIPRAKKQMLCASIDHILRLNPNVIEFNKHRVQNGETLSRIAVQYGTSIENLMIANNLYHADHIVSGKAIRIPHKIIPAKKQYSSQERSKLNHSCFGDI